MPRVTSHEISVSFFTDEIQQGGHPSKALSLVASSGRKSIVYLKAHRPELKLRNETLSPCCIHLSETYFVASDLGILLP